MSSFRRLQYLGLFLLIGLAMPISIVVAGGVAVGQLRKRGRTVQRQAMSCGADVECPPGFICYNGQCVLAD